MGRKGARMVVEKEATASIQLQDLQEELVVMKKEAVRDLVEA